MCTSKILEFRTGYSNVLYAALNMLTLHPYKRVIDPNCRSFWDIGQGIVSLPDPTIRIRESTSKVQGLGYDTETLLHYNIKQRHCRLPYQIKLRWFGIVSLNKE